MAAADSSKPARAATLPARTLLLALPFLSFLLLFLYVYSTTSWRPASGLPATATTTTTVATTTTTTVPLTPSPPSPHIRMRRSRYRSYDDYLRHQLNKTLDPRLRRVWATRDWQRKVDAFARLFAGLRDEGLLSNASRALCVGARLGQEVAALRQVGVRGALGIDLAPAPPLVARGDFHAQPFPDATFDFEFSNVFDHALYPDRFAAEVERTLRPGGVAVLHVAVHRRGDRYSANDLLDVRGLVGLFRRCDVVRVSKVDAFGLDTEVILRKKGSSRR
jgi:SAM-dependent methyltransferase